MNQQQRLPRCPRGSRRNKNTGLCEQSTVKSKSPTISRNITLVKRKSQTKQKRCPNGSYRNKITGLCEEKVVIIKRKSKSKQKSRPLPLRHRLSMSPRKSPVEIQSVIKNNKRNYNEVITPKILNFYKENATPIFESDVVNHPGDTNFRNVAFNYLKKRYNNLDIFENTFNQDPETIFFFIKSNNQIDVETSMAHSVMSFDTETGEIQNDINYDYLINQIKKCMNYSIKRFFAVGISLQAENLGHANMLIYDREKNIVELFDPHGYITMSMFKPAKVRFLIQYIFSKIKDNIRFIDSWMIYPFKGLQNEQCEEYLNRTNNEIKGYCGAWSFFYLHMRISNPNMPQLELIKQLKVEIKNKGHFFNMIRNYVKYILNKGYRHKYNIKPVRLRL